MDGPHRAVETAAQRGALRGLLAQSVLTASVPSCGSCYVPTEKQAWPGSDVLKARRVRLPLAPLYAPVCVGHAFTSPLAPDAKVGSQQVEVQKEVTGPGSHSH